MTLGSDPDPVQRLYDGEVNMRIWFIGLRITGSRMNLNLQKAGHEIVVYNRLLAQASEGPV